MRNLPARLATFTKAFVRRTHGTDLVEYGLLASIGTTLVIFMLSQIGIKSANFIADAAQEVVDRSAKAGSVAEPGGGGGGGGGQGGGGGGGQGGGQGGGRGQ